MTKLALALIVAGSVSVWGQDVISAHSGTIHYVEGKVTLDGDTVEPHFAQFPEVGNDHVLATEQGRAEVLMTPGVFLRLSEDSSFRMISNQLADTQIEILSGDALLEVDDLPKDNAITVKFLDSTTGLTRKGLYRFDAERHVIRVYQGSASTNLGEHTASAHSGKEIKVENDKLVSDFFNAKDTDPFYRWAERRSEYIATANVSAARQAGALGLTSSTSSWAWNPYYGMFTFLPGYGYAGYDGFGYSPFGYYFYSPMTVGYILPVSGYYYGSPRQVSGVSRGTTMAGNTATTNSIRSTVSSSGSSSAGSRSYGGPSMISTAPRGGVSAGAPSGGGAPVSVGGGVSSGGASRGAAMGGGGGGGAHR